MTSLSLWHHSPYDITLLMTSLLVFFFPCNKVATLAQVEQFTLSHISLCAFLSHNRSVRNIGIAVFACLRRLNVITSLVWNKKVRCGNQVRHRVWLSCTHHSPVADVKMNSQASGWLEVCKGFELSSSSGWLEVCKGFELSSSSGRLEVCKGFELSSSSGRLGVCKGFELSSSSGRLEVCKGFELSSSSGRLGVCKGFELSSSSGRLEVCKGFELSSSSGWLEVCKGFELSSSSGRIEVCKMMSL